ncbi:MAG: ATP synthase F1 subunit delta [Bacteroidetes bacterium HGW-Bacteroidetes-9]|jgi:F-type H+-transporting ATPase subunit delta|nr:MAG: ATP synthase F1 subunit delta [Bacteroidetes bacterium HGW-Bacteroidetes-9]
MDNPRINIRYATALFGLSQENNVLEQASSDMATLVAVCEQNRDLMALLKSPVIPVGKKTAIIREIFGKTLNKISMGFIEIIIRKRREPHLYNIAVEFGNLYREFRNIKKAVVTTISPLTDEMRKELLSIMSEQTGSTIELKEVTDPSIIGGMIVKLEGIQFDDSIRKKIQNLRKEFNVNTYIKGF